MFWNARYATTSKPSSTTTITAPQINALPHPIGSFIRNPLGRGRTLGCPLGCPLLCHLASLAHRFRSIRRRRSALSPAASGQEFAAMVHRLEAKSGPVHVRVLGTLVRCQRLKPTRESHRPSHGSGRRVAGLPTCRVQAFEGWFRDSRGHPARSHHSVSENLLWKMFAAIRQPRPFGPKQKATGSAYRYTIPRLPTSRRQLLRRLPNREFRSLPRRTINTIPRIWFRPSWLNATTMVVTTTCPQEFRGRPPSPFRSRHPSQENVNAVRISIRNVGT